jgi:hypothetical protein
MASTSSANGAVSTDSAIESNTAKPHVSGEATSKPNGTATSSTPQLEPSSQPSVKSIPPPSSASHSPPTTAGLSAGSFARAPTTPTIVVHSAVASSSPNYDASRPSTARGHDEPSQFLRLTTPIPTGSLDDLLSPERMKFSNRGSIIMDVGWDRIRRAGENGSLGSSSYASGAQNGLSQATRSARMLSADEASLSAKVRNLYETGGEEEMLAEQTLVEEEEDEEKEAETSQIQDPSQAPTSAGGPAPQSPRSVTSDKPPSNHSNTNIDRTRLHLRPSPSRLSTRSDGGASIQRTPYETAGGIEDWEDIRGDEIDRYGFIIARATASRGSHTSGGTFESSGPIQRVTTSLLDASNAPRKRNTMLRRMPSRASARSTSGTDGGPSRQPSRRSLKPGAGSAAVYGHRMSMSFSNSQASLKSHLSRQERKLLIGAGDMLTLPPRLADLAGSDATVPVMTRAMREKEWEREGKWKKMGRIRPGSTKGGGGMQFDFDPRDPKVISRTWKGIPDRWRATAWYSFLEASAKKKMDSPGEDLLFAVFHELQQENSADDVQIDCDVPRTINRHIMFRKRYRGGQRLLFRVLHALSLYFPEIGYVQGMAALAASLLCYYDEEHTFVMMVRLWQLRGLQRLYESGFEGLMDALSEFEKHWLLDGAVAKKLVSITETWHSHSLSTSISSTR